MDVRCFFVGFGESASDNGAEGGGGVGSAVFGFIVVSSSEDVSAVKPKEAEEPGVTFLLCGTATTFFDFPFIFTTSSSSLSLELGFELEEMDTFLFDFSATAFILTPSLSLELVSLLSVLCGFLVGSFSLLFESSESEISLEPSVMLDRSGVIFFDFPVTDIVGRFSALVGICRFPFFLVVPESSFKHFVLQVAAIYG